MKNSLTRLWLLVLLLLASAGIASAQLRRPPVRILGFLGNTQMYLTGVGGLPFRGAFVEPNQSVTVTTQTYPISSGQTVTLIYTTNNWASMTSVAMPFDHNVGNNSQWFTVLGPLPKGSDVQFYLRADSDSSGSLYDNNSGQNFGYLSRFEPAARRGAILQWFSTDYRTIMQRLPEVVQAGYGALYLPPPQKSAGGGFSVGYNPFDRFDLGSRFQQGTVGTRYGTASDLQNLIRLAHRFGLEVYCDLVFNHNDNRGSTAINAYPAMIPEDFHIRSSQDTGNNEVDFNNAPPFGFGTLNYDVVGLADIAQEDGNQVENGPFNLPTYATFNGYGKPSFVRDLASPDLYPGHLPVAEDVRQYLLRWGWWLTTQVGFDGYRLDAVRHTPPNFFGWVQTQPGPFGSVGNLIPYLYSLNPNLYIFGECFDTSGYDQREYLKTGMNMLDFNLKFNLDSLLNSSGFGSLGNTITNGYGIDSSLGMTYELGGLATDTGVAFIQSHDNGPPQANNLGYAFILTRPGSSIVYYDGNNENPSDYSQFPKPGRYDALGAGGDTITRLVDARDRFGRGTLITRWSSDNLVVYERQVSGSGVMLVGLNIRGDFTALSAQVQTSFAPGTVLTDQSGQMPDVTVDGAAKVSLTVPSNSVPGITNNARGYVIYAPRAPSPVAGIEPVTVKDAVQGTTLPYSTYTSTVPAFGPPGSYRATTTTNGQIDLQIQTDAAGVTADVEVDSGVAVPGKALLSNTPEGLADGFFPITAAQPGSFDTGTLDLRGLDDGLHLLRVRVFADTGSRPGVFQDFTVFVYLAKSPTAGINGDLTKYSAPQVVQNLLSTSNSNRLDSMVVSNDDQFLYVGLAGSVDSSSSFLNGMSLLMSVNGAGAPDLNQLADDSGEATRLLKDARLRMPSGFTADFGLSSFRGAGLSSAPEAPQSGDPVSPWPIGPEAGLFRIDSPTSNYFKGTKATLAWRARANKTDPASGLEAAIPLRCLFKTQAITPGTQIGLIAYLGTTGETGSVFKSTDPNRAVFGNRPKPVAYLTNQFLPTQAGIFNDPGTGAVTLNRFFAYSLALAGNAPDISISPSSVTGTAQGNIATQQVALFPSDATTFGQPMYLVVNPHSSGAVLLNATGISMISGLPYIKLPARLLTDGPRKIYLTYSFTSAMGTPTFELKRGPGIP